MISISGHTKFRTVEMINNQKHATLVVALKQIISIYQNGGLKVVDVLSDNQRECVRGAMADLGSCLNIASADEHVPEIEWCIRTIKERLWSIYTSWTFKKCHWAWLLKRSTHQYLGWSVSHWGVHWVRKVIHQIIKITVNLSLALCANSSSPWQLNGTMNSWISSSPPNWKLTR